MPCAHHKHDNVDGIVRNEPWYDHEREFVKVCHCERCVKHGEAVRIMEILREHFKGTDMQLVACPSPGRCHEGNNVVVNDDILVIANPLKVVRQVEGRLEDQREQRRLNPEEKRDVIKVCHGPTCGERDGKPMLAVLGRHFRGTKTKVMVCGCTGNCSRASNVVVNGNIIHRQNPQRVLRSVESELGKQRIKRARESGPISADEAEEVLGL